MAKLTRKWIELVFGNDGSLRAEDINYDASNTIKAMIDASYLWEVSGKTYYARNETGAYTIAGIDGTTGVNGQDLTIRGGNFGPSATDGGDLILQGGTGSPTPGQTIIKTSAGTEVVTVDDTLGFVFNDTYADVDFTIRKLTAGEAFKYDSGTDIATFDCPVVENEYIAFPNAIRIGDSSTGTNLSGSAIAIGDGAGGTNSNNGIVAVGWNALGNAGAARVSCLAIGPNALGASAGGQRCLAIGGQALYNMNNGSRNVALGDNAGWTCVSGSDNVFLGYTAGYYETGSDKLFIDNDQRTDEATARLNSMIYGEFNSTRASQNLFLNANVNVRETLTAENTFNTSGAVVFNVDAEDNDFTINKLTTGTAFVYDAGTDDFTFSSPTRVLTNGSQSEPALAVGASTWGFYRSATQGLKVVVNNRELMNFNQANGNTQVKGQFYSTYLDPTGAFNWTGGVTGSSTDDIRGWVCEPQISNPSQARTGKAALVAYESKVWVRDGVFDGSFTGAIGFYDKPDFSGTQTGTRTITNYYGMLLDAGTDPTNMVLTNRYGIYIENFSSAATLNYGIYSAHDNNYIKGLTFDSASADYFDFATDYTPGAHTEGRAYYDNVDKTLAIDVVNGSTLNIGQENVYPVMNNTGSQINNGSVVYQSGVDEVNDQLEIALADADSTNTSSETIGVATHDIANGTLGLVTRCGKIRGINTSSWSANDILYLSGTPGGLTNVKPTYPQALIEIGKVLVVDATDGVVYVDVHAHQIRTYAVKSYSFSTTGIGTGDYYIAGFYEAADADANLTQASTTQTFGTANAPYAAHPFIVAGGAGTVDTGQVGLRVSGTKIDDSGTRTASFTEVLTDDITTLSTNDYIEAAKFIGTVTFELYVVSGTPTTYSLDFNYGTAKYEDIGNRKFTVVDFENVGLAGANDSSFNIELLKHSTTGWTYAATGFVPGDGSVCDMSSDTAPEDNLANGQPFAYKRANLNTVIDGTASEGIVIKVTVSQNNSVRYMSSHIGFYMEDEF
jgi:hypothetical protein